MNNTLTPTRSVLASLRACIPTRNDITPSEAFRIAELQANRLLELHAITTWPIPRDIISELPKIRILPTRSLADGASFWDNRSEQWIILLNTADSWRRQRFTLAHEYKHIIDHTTRHQLYHDRPSSSAQRQAEHTADYFAGCLLIPRRLLKRAWGQGIQRTDELAHLFQVSEQAIGVRLRQTGLVETEGWASRRCHLVKEGPIWSSHHQLSIAPVQGGMQ